MNFYKKWGLAIAALILAVGITWALKSVAQSEQMDVRYKPIKSDPNKVYEVKLTLNEWGNKLQYLDIVKQQLRNSDLPSKQVAFISDSLLTPFQTQITQQIQLQLAQEQRRDTTKPKK